MPPWPPAARGWYATVVLTASYVLSFVDRQILTLLVGPIQADLGLNDTQVSLLIGAAFAICYTTFGFPLGWLVDRYDRRVIAAAGVGVWSAMTALSGLAGGYAQLFAARMGVGLGEAALTPASYSLLADSFAPGRYVRAIGIYMSGAIVGVATAYALGGQLAAWVAGRTEVVLWGVGAVRSWQAPFLVLLVPGLVVALLVLAIREPPRRMPPQRAGEPGLLRFLRARALVFGLLFVAMGMQSVVVYANLTWMPSLLTRRFGWQPGEIGLALAGVFLGAGLLGNLTGAWVGGRLLERARPLAYLGLCIASTAALLLISPLGPLAATPSLVLTFLAPTIFLTSMPTAIVPVAVQLVTPGRFRGRVGALYLFATQLLGLLFGPTLVAVFTDYVFRDRAAIGWSQAATVGLASAMSLAAFLLVLKPFSRLIAESDRDRLADG